jgi:hypothetical protein
VFDGRGEVRVAHGHGIERQAMLVGGVLDERRPEQHAQREKDRAKDKKPACREPVQLRFLRLRGAVRGLHACGIGAHGK